MTPSMPEAVPATAGTRTRTHSWWSGQTWLHMFLGGLGLWVATVVVTFATGNANLVPTILLLGSFLVPVAFVAYAFAHADEVVTAQRIFTASSTVASSVCSAPPSWRPPSCAGRPSPPFSG